MSARPRRTPLEIAIDIAGGQTAVARKLKISQQSVFDWIERNRCPSRRVLWLERETERAGKRVPRWRLRPDLYPREQGATA